MVKYQKANYTILVAVALSLIIITEPALAEDVGEELESVDWLGVIEAFLRFIADVLEAAAGILRDGIDWLIESFG